MYRYKKIFPADVRSISVPKDLTHFTRLGQIVNVDPENGKCVIKWLDRAGGFRSDVLLTQGSHKEWHIPERGTVVLVQTGAKDTSYIIRYINLGQASRVLTKKTLPKLKEGEKLWEAGGSYIWMTRGGTVRVATQTEGYWELNNDTGTFKSETVNWKVSTEGGLLEFGLVNRLVTNADGTASSTIIKDVDGNAYTEYRLRVVEKADTQLGVSGLSTPLCDIILGTVINDDGDPVNKDGTATLLPSQEVCLQIKVVKSGTTLFKAILNKKGEFTLSAADSTVMDFLKGLVINSGTKGVARVDDEVQVTIASSDIVSLGLQAPSGGGPITGPAPGTVIVKGKINKGSDKVKIG